MDTAMKYPTACIFTDGACQMKLEDTVQMHRGLLQAIAPDSELQDRLRRSRLHSVERFPDGRVLFTYDLPAREHAFTDHMLQVQLVQFASRADAPKMLMKQDIEKMDTAFPAIGAQGGLRLQLAVGPLLAGEMKRMGSEEREHER